MRDSSCEELAAEEIGGHHHSHAKDSADSSNRDDAYAKELERKGDQEHEVRWGVGRPHVDGAIGGIAQEAFGCQAVHRLVVPDAEGEGVQVVEAHKSSDDENCDQDNRLCLRRPEPRGKLPEVPLPRCELHRPEGGHKENNAGHVEEPGGSGGSTAPEEAQRK